MECFNYFFFLKCLLISLVDLRPGVIINSPAGEDVHKGVLKDYTRDDVNVDNFLAISLVKIALTRYRKNGNSGPNDHNYIFYSDHGGSGVLVKILRA
ncbi:hypothetical protein KY284_037147 [Solanum tuberosum]|nr:hypothetical protein KY284_037147 [Solanum tuberosum]